MSFVYFYVHEIVTESVTFSPNLKNFKPVALRSHFLSTLVLRKTYIFNTLLTHMTIMPLTVAREFPVNSYATMHMLSGYLWTGIL